ncbi:MAG: amidohydrolase, partial [Chloroflexota bacterium]|nr:amidohydrolase [Chloroflexota bacterium]
MRTLIRGAVVVTCDAHHTVLPQADVVIEDEHLAYVGSAYVGEYDSLVHAQGKLLMPGLINAHTHTPMSLFRGLADDVDLRTFLEERAWPREARLTSEHVYAGSSLSLLEMLKAGVTTYVDMYFYEEDLARAARDSGLRAIITPGILEAPGLTSVLGSWEQRTRQVLDFRERWEGREGRITTGLGPHALYTLPREALAEIATEARQAQALTHVHLCETRQEVAEFSARGLGTPVAALASVGFFEGKVLAAHSVWLDDQDIQTYAAQGVGVAHCPLSNAKLGAGVAPVPQFVASNINVGLGTDGAATNNSLDLWEEMRFAPLLAKAVGLDPTLLPAREMLWMATRRGALAINRPDLGALVPGYKADLLLLRLDDTTTTPILDEQSYVGHLVNSMTSRLVDSVWVNGQLLLSGGEVLRTDEEKVRARAQRAGEELSGRASVPSTHLVSHPASVNHTVEDAVRAIQSRYT